MIASRIVFAVTVNLLYFMPVCEDADVDASIVIAEVMTTGPKVFDPLALPSAPMETKSLLFAP